MSPELPTGAELVPVFDTYDDDLLAAQVRGLFELHEMTPASLDPYDATIDALSQAHTGLPRQGDGQYPVGDLVRAIRDQQRDRLPQVVELGRREHVDKGETADEHAECGQADVARDAGLEL